MHHKTRNQKAMTGSLKAAMGLLALLMFAAYISQWTMVSAENQTLAETSTTHPISMEQIATKHVLGATTAVSEEETNLEFVARVDTGAKTCSIDTLQKQVIDGSKYMEENVGKTVRFLVANRQGQTQWLERTIAEVRKIRTSEGEETRYLVPLHFTCKGVQREVLVTLNDRSRMTYAMLLGRNFLAGQFVVDVASEGGATSELLAGE